MTDQPTDPLQALTELYEDVTKGLGWTRRLEKLFREKDPEQTEVSFSDEAENWNEASLLFERFVDLFPALKEQMERVEDRPSLGDRWTIEWSTRAEKAEAEVKRLREALSKYESLPDYHVTEYTLSGWSVEHPLACRDSGSLQDCFVHKAVAVENADLSEPPLPPGRYRTWLGDSVEYEVLAESQEAEG